jgi:hypothetical protein
MFLSSWFWITAGLIVLFVLIAITDHGGHGQHKYCTDAAMWGTQGMNYKYQTTLRFPGEPAYTGNVYNVEIGNFDCYQDPLGRWSYYGVDGLWHREG